MDEFAAAEAAQDALNRLAEITPCLEPACTSEAVPLGPPYEFGTVHDLKHPHGGRAVMQRFVCAVGHRYDIERRDLE